MATLVVVDGPAKGQKFALEAHRLIMIGRDHQCAFQVVDGAISRQHVQIKRLGENNTHAAIDFGSANGVHINAKRIFQETPLSDGDVIRIGDSSILYAADDDSEAKSISELMRKHGELRHDTREMPIDDLLS